VSITELRANLEEARAHIAQIEDGQAKKALDKLDRALKDLAPGRLLTTTEAAELLGIGSVNTLKLLVRRHGINYERHGNRMMIPLSEIEQLQKSSIMRGAQSSDRMHTVTKDLGTSDGLTPEQTEDLKASRPEQVSWEISSFCQEDLERDLGGKRLSNS
jgi:excisionase family DNA binding protein